MTKSYIIPLVLFIFLLALGVMYFGLRIIPSYMFRNIIVSILLVVIIYYFIVVK